MTSSLEKLIIIAGPTASGKSDAAVRLAQRLHGSIISADSMQVYRGMDIGSAKITKEEMCGIPHYLIDILDPKEEWNVTLFQSRAKECVREITSQGRLPILCGGTGFYIQSLLYDISFTEIEDNSLLRARLQDVADGRLTLGDITGISGLVSEMKSAGVQLSGPEALHCLLSQIDPAAASEIHPNNVKRVIRAIEFSLQGGGKISEHNVEQQQRPPAYDAVFFVLTMPRQQLYERIDRRVDLMVESGLIHEVEQLMELGLTSSDISMQGLGYRQVIDALNGLCTMDEAVEQIKTQTRHFAKRQLTWFKREEKRNPDQIVWVDRSNYPDADTVADYMYEIICERFAARDKTLKKCAQVCIRRPETG